MPQENGQWIDLRSDTVTHPTPAMRKAMAEAPLGDDVYGDDPTVNKLEEMAAARIGKEAAMFVPTGTMGNQVAIMTHTKHGDEIIVTPMCHIVHYEAGAPARLSGVNFAMAKSDNQFIYADDVRRLVRPVDHHFPKVSLLCLENALTNGDVVPLDIMQEAADAAHALGMQVHLDGARIFNAALALGVDAKEVAAPADSVMFCISKGLCAPVGSLLCGSKAFIEKARFMRKIVGGGMRQAGVLAAAGIVALEQMVDRLPEDHENAKYMAKQLNTIAGVTAFEERTKIDMVFWKPEDQNFSNDQFVEYMKQNGVRIGPWAAGEYRFVTHWGVDRQDVDKVVKLVADFVGGKAG